MAKVGKWYLVCLPQQEAQEEEFILSMLLCHFPLAFMHLTYSERVVRRACWQLAL